jgi:hypothetical protein
MKPAGTDGVGLGFKVLLEIAAFLVEAAVELVISVL